MTREVSAGCILFRERSDKREYLLLKSRPGDWEFPKGGVEGEEELQQTVLREVEEETGLENVKLLDGFRDDYDYEFTFGGDVIQKTVHLFLAKAFEPDVDISTEHSDYQWRTYDQAINTLSHDSTKRILREAEEFLETEGIPA